MAHWEPIFIKTCLVNTRMSHSNLRIYPPKKKLVTDKAKRNKKHRAPLFLSCQKNFFFSFECERMDEIKLPVDLRRLFAKLAYWADLNRHRISMILQGLHEEDNQNQAYVILQTMVCLSNETEKTKIQLQHFVHLLGFALLQWATFAFQIKIELNRISSIHRTPTLYIIPKYSMFHHYSMDLLVDSEIESERRIKCDTQEQKRKKREATETERGRKTIRLT